MDFAASLGTAQWEQVGMVLHHYEAASMSPLFDHFEPSHLDPDVVAAHVFKMLTEGVLRCKPTGS